MKTLAKRLSAMLNRKTLTYGFGAACMVAVLLVAGHTVYTSVADAFERGREVQQVAIGP